jgi:protein O-mannosyl-transferase
MALPTHQSVQSDGSRESPLSILFKGLILLVLSFVIYLPAIHGLELWDDAFHLTAVSLRSFAGLRDIWFKLGVTQQYYPLLHSFFWLENKLWGQSLIHYHIITIILHATNAFLFYRILRKLTIKGSYLASLIFCVHPLCVESVAWISEEKNTLSLFFYLTAAYAYFNWRSDQRKRTYLLAFGLFVLALLTKSVTATLPAALIVIGMWREGASAFKRLTIPLIPWLLIATVSGIFTAWVEYTIIGAGKFGSPLSPLSRIILLGKIPVFYAGKFIWPEKLSFIYSHWRLDPSSLTSYTATFLVILFMFLCVYFRKQISGVLCLALLFLGTLFPVLGFFTIYPFAYAYVADHFTYHAMLYLCVGVSTLWYAWHGRWISSQNHLKRTLPRSVALAVVCLLAAKTSIQAKNYKDSETLYKATIQTTPDSFLAHNNLAILLSEKGKSEEALAHFKTALAINPNYPQSYKNYADELSKQGNHRSEVLSLYLHAIALDPTYSDAHLSLANELTQYPDKIREADKEFNVVLRLRANDAKAHNDYAIFLGNVPSRHEEAIDHYLKSLALDPSNPATHANLAYEYSKEEVSLPDAIREYTASLALNPVQFEVHNNFANLLASLPGHSAEAVSHLESAIKINPMYAEAHNNLANLLVKDPYRLAEAVLHYKKAIESNPHYAEAHFNLAVAYANMNQLQDAVTQFELALRDKPDFKEAREALRQLIPR